jgi:hypothetical protein
MNQDCLEILKSIAAAQIRQESAILALQSGAEQAAQSAYGNSMPTSKRRRTSSAPAIIKPILNMQEEAVLKHLKAAI